MDPYKPPESDVNLREDKPPTVSILAVYCLICLSFLLFLAEELLYASDTDTGLLDWTNYFIVPVWAAILYWATSSILKRKNNPKYTFLFLAILVFGLSFIDLQAGFTSYLAIGEATCFLLVFFLLNRKETKEWFE